MTNVSKSPQRNTFQLECAKERAEQDGRTEIPEIYEQFWKDAKQQDEENIANPDWQKNNLEYDLRSNEWLCAKARNSEAYAQNLYAAMCNMQFQKLDVIPILKEELWSCSWRHAGGIIADMRQQGDYIDWYCSGIGDGLGNGDTDGTKGYVGEGVVTDEIKEDLKQLGWIPVEWEDN